ncbi:MAG: hypothetical protein ISP90_14550 [Nevskia sp.]|nr:hypothetical protein [Nevskia sp.]
MSFVYRFAGAACAAACLVSAPALACSSCGCTLGTEWASQGYSTGTGLRLDLRYDFVDQSQLRLGAHAVDKHSYVPADPDQEIQQGTLTRFYTLSASYNLSRDWGLDVQLPYLDRQHQTIGTAGAAVSGSQDSGIGDLRILGRFQGLFADRTLGLQFGLKLPTGAFHGRFGSGPQAGSPLDRGLQPGSGTTDLLLGIYHYQPIGRDWDRFGQLQLRQAIDSREQFRPSTQVTANFGLRYVANPALIPQLQVNLRWEGHETGVQGDYANSGDRAVFISPGLTVRVRRGLQAYGFLQLPAYQYYHGLQLAPTYTVSAGVSYGF